MTEEEIQEIAEELGIDEELLEWFIRYEDVIKTYVDELKPTIQ